MIGSLKIHNFQSHRKTELNFEGGVNAIVGQSDSGKSAIFRALYWLLSNRPAGEAFRSSWGGDTSVSIELSDGKSIQRLRGKDNSYQLDGAVFKAIGQDVPQQISEALNIEPVNVQTQHDSPYLLSGSSGDVAAELNKAASLENIDRAMASVNSMLREWTQAIKTAEKQLSDEEQGLLAYEGLDRLEIDLTASERLFSGLSKLKSREQGIRATIHGFGDFSAQIAEAELILKYVPKLTKLEGMAKKLEELSLRAGRLSEFIGEIEAEEQELAFARKKVESANKEFDELMPNVCPLCGGKVK